VADKLKNGLCQSFGFVVLGLVCSRFLLEGFGISSFKVVTVGL